MAGNKFIASTAVAGIASGTAGTDVCGLTVQAPANQDVIVKAIHVYGDGITALQKPVEIQLEYSTPGTGAGSSAAQVTKTSNSQVTTQSTCKQGYTTRPTKVNTILPLLINPQAGQSILWPFGDGKTIPGGSQLGVIINNATNPGVDFTIGLECEE